MTIKIKAIKETAREKLLGHWNEHLPFALMLMALELLCIGITDLFPADVGLTPALFRIAVAAILQVLLGLFQAGTALHFLKTLRGEASPLQDILIPLKKQPDRYLIVGLIEIGAGCLIYSPIFLMDLIPAGSSAMRLTFLIVWLIAGTALYVALRAAFAMSRFLLLDDEQLGAIASLKKSADMMKGQKMKLVLLILSLVGFFLLALCTLGFGLLWVLPYTFTSVACFYETLRTA